MKLDPNSFHPSQRGFLAGALYNEMVSSQDVFLLTGDLGFGMFDKIKSDFPDRFINTGAAEQAMLDIACGLALEKKIPFVYTITPFYLRAFETLRTYVNHEKIPVRMIGGGRDKDYEHDGFSHDASDVQRFLNPLENIKQYFPQDKEEVPDLVHQMITENQPSFISLRR